MHRCSLVAQFCMSPKFVNDLVSAGFLEVRCMLDGCLCCLLALLNALLVDIVCVWSLHEPTGACRFVLPQLILAPSCSEPKMRTNRMAAIQPAAGVKAKGEQSCPPPCDAGMICQEPRRVRWVQWWSLQTKWSSRCFFAKKDQASHPDNWHPFNQ
jgi:hypothetical protein